jgi:hypothetical protein
VVSLSTPPSSVTSGQGNAVVGDAERSQRVGGVAGMVGHRCHTAYVNWMGAGAASSMVFAAAHAGDDHFDWAAFVAAHLRWQDLAEERHEGAGDWPVAAATVSRRLTRLRAAWRGE